MDASEAAEQCIEHAEELAAEDTLRKTCALWIGILALLLAVSGLGGGNAAEDMVDFNVRASDSWSFYQAKNIRQTSNKIAAEQLEAQLLIQPNVSSAARKKVEEKIADFRATAERYESEPDPKEPNNPLRGEGKKQLKEQAKNFEAQREIAGEKDSNFDFADILLQIAVVLGSVAILASSRSMLLMSFVAGVSGSLLALNGYNLFVHLPW